MKRILHLTLKKKWFDLIASGKKTTEYRDDKEHWRQRLCNSVGEPRRFDEVWFRNGYSEDAPFMRVEWKDCEWIDFVPNPGNGEILEGPVYAISLGDVLEVRVTDEGAANTVGSAPR